MNPLPTLRLPATRRSIEDEIERLISLLDSFDPDPDLEGTGDDEPNSDDEPLLGWTEPFQVAVTRK